MTKLLSLLLIIFSALLAGCGSGSSSGLAKVTVTPESAMVAFGSTQQFKAVGTYSNNTTQDLTASATWASADTQVATIVPGGLATANMPGTTAITATMNGVTGQATLNVVVVPTLVSISVGPANPTISVGSTEQFTAVGAYDDGAIQIITSTVTWSSSDQAVATVSLGLATGLAQGSTIITASVGPVAGTAQLTVGP